MPYFAGIGILAVVFATTSEVEATAFSIVYARVLNDARKVPTWMKGLPLSYVLTVYEDDAFGVISKTSFFRTVSSVFSGRDFAVSGASPVQYPCLTVPINPQSDWGNKFLYYAGRVPRRKAVKTYNAVKAMEPSVMKYYNSRLLVNRLNPNFDTDDPENSDQGFLKLADDDEMYNLIPALTDSGKILMNDLLYPMLHNLLSLFIYRPVPLQASIPYPPSPALAYMNILAMFQYSQYYKLLTRSYPMQYSLILLVEASQYPVDPSESLFILRLWRYDFRFLLSYQLKCPFSDKEPWWDASSAKLSPANLIQSFAKCFQYEYNLFSAVDRYREFLHVRRLAALDAKDRVKTLICINLKYLPIPQMKKAGALNMEVVDSCIELGYKVHEDIYNRLRTLIAHYRSYKKSSYYAAEYYSHRLMLVICHIYKHSLFMKCDWGQSAPSLMESLNKNIAQMQKEGKTVNMYYQDYNAMEHIVELHDYVAENSIRPLFVRTLNRLKQAF